MLHCGSSNDFPSHSNRIIRFPDGKQPTMSGLAPFIVGLLRILPSLFVPAWGLCIFFFFFFAIYVFIFISKCCFYFSNFLFFYFILIFLFTFNFIYFFLLLLMIPTMKWFVTPHIHRLPPLIGNNLFLVCGIGRHKLESTKMILVA